MKINLGKRFDFPDEAAAQFADILEKSQLGNDLALVEAVLDVCVDMLEICEARCKVFVRDKKGELFFYSPHVVFNFPGLNSFKPDGHPILFEGVRVSHRFNPVRSPSKKSFELSPERTEKLHFIRDMHRVYNDVDALRFAFTIFNELLTVKLNRNEIVIQDKSGHESPYAPLCLVRSSLVTGLQA